MTPLYRIRALRVCSRTNFMSKRTLLSDTHVDKQILLHLCSALLAVYIVFLAGIEQTENTVGCKVVSGLLHYLLMASFCWMLVEAVRQFLRYYNRSHCLPEKFVLKGSIVSWGKFCVFQMKATHGFRPTYMIAHRCRNLSVFFLFKIIS